MNSSRKTSRATTWCHAIMLAMALFALISTCASHPAYADLTCTLNRSVTGASATGTITVDKIGTLAAANLTAWNITVTTTNPVTLTNANSVLNLGTVAPTMTSTASSLTITPITTLTTGQNSFFAFVKGGFGGQFYGLFNDNPWGDD